MATEETTRLDTRQLPYYLPQLQEVKDPLRKILEEYSGIPPGQVLDHLWRVRERAWDVHPYPCIGQWRFADLNMSLHPQYPDVLERLKQGQILLDLGCCFAQDIRKLVYDGVPAESLYAADLHSEYIDLGFELFKDKDKLASTLFAADLFDPESRLKELRGKVDVIHAGSFFHLFDWYNQVEVGKKVVELLRPEKGSLLLGRQTGTIKPGASQYKINKGGEIYRHDSATFKRLWEEIGVITGTSWEVEAKLVEREEFANFGDGENRRWIIFSVQRL